jgi:hypothetical protein
MSLMKPMWAWSAETQAVASNGNRNFKLNGIKTQGPGGIGRLKRVIIDLDLDITTDATVGGMTTAELYKLVASVTISDGKESWGANQLPGVALAARDYISSGRAHSYIEKASGDAAIPASTNNAIRHFQLVYDYGRYGEKGDELCPASKEFVDNGTVNVKFGVFPDNVTVNTGNIQVICEGFFEPKVKAVPRIFTEVMSPTGNDTALGFSGQLLALDLMQPLNDPGTAPDHFDGTEISTMTLSADSVSIIDQTDPQLLRPEELNVNPEVASADVQRHFVDPIGGTNPVVLPLFPLGPTDGCPLGNLPTGDTFQLKLVGTGAFADMQLIKTYSRKLTNPDIGLQWKKCGCKDPSVDASTKIHDTANKAPLVNDRLDGFLPVVKGAA